jgi:signal transduction histidine kinase/AmiR/NasT family two-component response regulator/HPt (histidine-containing phosphotransfer) domain-containing protein
MWRADRSSTDGDGAHGRISLVHSVATRGFVAVAGVLLPVIIAVLAIAVVRDYRQELADVESGSSSQARFLATVSPEAVFFRDFLTLETLVRQAVEEPTTVHVVFIDTSGASMTRFVDRSDADVVRASGDEVDHDSSAVADRLASAPLIRELRRPIVSEGVQLGEVRLSYSIEGARADAQRFAIGALLVAVVFGALVTALTLVVFHRSVRRPLRQLTEQTRAIADGNFGGLLEVRRDDEIGALRRSFNEMALRLDGTLAGLERARDEAQQADRAKSEFLANISHEVRTPLNAVLGLGDVLLDTELAAEQRALLTTMRRSGDVLLEMLNDILDFSKLENGALDLDDEPFELRKLVTSTVELFAGTCGQKGISLAVEIGAACPRYVRGDGDRLRQVLVNLIGNAVKFTDHGAVTVSVATVDGPTESLRCSVADTGIGIDPARADGLFEPFQQGDTTTTRVYGGTGLGLAICQRLVEEMGGSISASGELGDGAVFSFVLPLPAVDPVDGSHEPDEPGDAAARLSPLRILLAEDNKVNQLVATRMLERLGYDVDVVNDGVEAVEHVLQNEYDLVLMDIQMPRLDGVQAAERIRAEVAAERRPSIVAFTAHAPDHTGDGPMSAVMDGYLAKPLRTDDLIAVLRRASSERSPMPGVGPPAPQRSDRLAGAAAEQHAPLDAEHLRSLFGDGGEDVVRDVLPLFLAEADRSVREMRTARIDADGVVFRRAAHSLKGSARSVAALSLGTICDRLELLAADGRWCDVDPLLESVAAELDRVALVAPRPADQ